MKTAGMPHSTTDPRMFPKSEPAERNATFLALLLVAALALACGPSKPPQTTGGPVATRRLTGAQFHTAIGDVFGKQIEVTRGLEPDRRQDGLVAVGTAQATTSASGFERVELVARSIAAR